MTVNNKASIEDQKKMVAILKNLERPPDMQEESVREQDLIVAGCFHNIEEPEECIRELLAAGIVYRAEGDSGDVIKRTEKDYGN
jgi:hypothetical protein